MSYARFFEEEGLMPSELYAAEIPEGILATYPILESKFMVKSETGKFEMVRARLFRSLLVLDIPEIPEREVKYMNLSFMRSNYEIEGSMPTNKYRIDLMRFLQKQSLYTDKLEKTEEWMEALSKFCINYNFYSKFTIHNLLGKGAFGKVYRVTKQDHPEVEKAAKVLEKKFFKKNQKRFMIAEIQALQLLNHPNIIKVEEVHETSEEVVVVMEIMRQGLLSDFLSTKKVLSLQLIKAILYQILAAVDYMGEMKVIHRDIKPSNILISETKTFGQESIPFIKIVDMGISCFENQPATHTFCGTPGYLAPEVFLLEKTPQLPGSVSFGINSKVDVFSSGVIFYQLIARKSPFKSSEEMDTKKTNEIGKISYDHNSIMKFCKNGVSLLKRMLDPKSLSRISAREALSHDFFKTDFPLIKWFNLGAQAPTKMIPFNQSGMLDVPAGPTGANGSSNKLLYRMRSKSYDKSYEV
jgi:serine/threonine protein kinase